MHNTRTLKSPDPRHLCLQPQRLQDHQPLQRWRKCKMWDNSHQLIWWLKIHKRILHDETNSLFTCLTSISSETNVSVKFSRPWKIFNVFTHTITAQNHQEEKRNNHLQWRYHVDWVSGKREIAICYKGRVELVPKDGKSIADCRGALESVIFAMYGSKHVKLSFHN